MKLLGANSRWLSAALAITLSPIVAYAAAPERRLDCRAVPADCPKERAEVERLISSSTKLVRLRRATDLALAKRKREPGVTRAATTALDADEAAFRRNLKRDLYFADGEDDANRSILAEALEYRLRFLEDVTLHPAGIVGHWQNVSGSIVVAAPVDGLYRIYADPVDIDDLGWTCEMEATAALQGSVLVADLGRGESLSLRLEQGILRSDHRPPSEAVSPYCGNGGHVGGTWFRRKSHAP